ncbi:HdeA/HdeB family chaperone [Methylocapsa sp. S129]|uniref:HdeA/HdeB family chaperone n=1 Tax=Methylocapsa sp. S129 TaxID=1641869 RepID=UPI00131C59F9|nr:HdeA/HdeB family chaperone [Methylocapsa sp. S129]
MKLRLASVLVAALVAPPAMAQDLDFSKITCGQFLSSPKDQVGTILVWLEGFYTAKNAPPIMYQDKTVKDAKALDDYCNAHQEDGIIKAADTVMPVK